MFWKEREIEKQDLWAKNKHGQKWPDLEKK